jgi:hypothetical protein
MMGKRNTKTAKLVKTLRKQATSPRNQYLALTAGTAYVAERLVRSALTQGWRKVYKEDPPRNPERPDVSWGQAFAWTALTAVAFSTAGLFARRGAAVGWKRYTGLRIPE